MTDHRLARRDLLKATGAVAIGAGVATQTATAQSAEGPTVYVGSGQQPYTGRLYAVDAATGEQKWAFTQPSGAVRSSPTVADGTVYVGSDGTFDSDDSALYAVDAATGEQEWAFTQPSGAVRLSPTVVSGTVYVGSGVLLSDGPGPPGDGTLHAVDADSGEQEWAFETSEWVRSSPTVADGTVYLGAVGRFGETKLGAVDAATGDREWGFEIISLPRSSPTVAGGTVYVWSMVFAEGILSAMDADSGEQEWAFGTSGAVRSSPTVADGTVYVGSRDETLYAVDADSGEEEWAFETSDAVRSSPTVVANPQDGDSVGSRVRLGTLGHHGNRAEGRISSGDDNSNSGNGGDGFGPGFGIGGALTGLGGAGYLLKRRLDDEEPSE